ncbi:MAG: hypothetical protein KAS32_15105 [Candidatus Peribacteraceae bacterium]|nr:hypothetical protein [Candidatus Peribacteraceae bacterium]
MNEEITSNCCNAPIYDDSDICSRCRDHCGGQKECSNCDSAGKLLIWLGKNPVDEPCWKCNGEGYIEVEL